MADEIHDLTSLLHETQVNQRSAPFAEVDGRQVVVSRFSQHPKWEIHPNGDEFLHIIEGELELTLLHGNDPTTVVLGPGTMAVVPQGVWHSPMPRGVVALLAMADYEGTAVSDVDDPRGDEP